MTSRLTGTLAAPIRCLLHHTIDGIGQRPKLIEGEEWLPIAEEARLWCDQMARDFDFSLTRTEVHLNRSPSFARRSPYGRLEPWVKI